MIEVLEFIFSGFWTFVGCVILASIVTQGLVALVAILRGVK